MLRKCLAVAVARAVVLGAFLAVLGLSSEAVPAPPPPKIRAMLDWYGCWTPGFPPAGAEPTRAVISYRDGEPELVSAALGFDILHDPDANAGFVLYGICGDRPAVH